MTQNEKLSFLIRELINENPNYRNIDIPSDKYSQKQLFRSLLNIRPPKPMSDEIIRIQDEYLTEEIRITGITVLDSLTPAQNHLYLWKGDITTLCVDAIVNAANNQMLGCFIPCHSCIDNAIHTFAGIQLRLACADIMQTQDKSEKTGKAKITPAFNLPSKYIIHTVGPIVSSSLTKQDCELLSSCYRSCLELSEQNNVNSIAFCCISTGEFRFPNEKAAEIAVNTVTSYIKKNKSEIKVIFNVFNEKDYEIYRRILYCYKTLKR